jgi:multiple sugar transport system ATP-binding protein
MSVLELKDLTKIYGKSVAPCQGISLEVGAQEFVSVVGPSGCGKSTLLKLIAGLEQPTSGSIHIGGRDVTAEFPGSRDISMVFQSYALYPHMNVFDNIASPLRIRKIGKVEIEKRVRGVAEQLEIGGVLSRKPGALSGGQRQRVALARALVRNPAVYLLDEPLSNLDASLRDKVRSELRALFRSTSAPVVYVTHDQIEALSLSDRIVVLDNGKIQQVGTPQEVYYHPSNVTVARFIGTPKMNIVPGDERWSRSLGKALGGDILIGIRPEALTLEVKGTLFPHVSIIDSEMQGSHYLSRVLVGDATELLVLHRERVCSTGHGLSCDSRHLHYFNAETGQRILV